MCHCSLVLSLERSLNLSLCNYLCWYLILFVDICSQMSPLPRVFIASSGILPCIIFVLAVSRSYVPHSLLQVCFKASASRNQAMSYFSPLILPLYSSFFTSHIIFLFTQMSWHPTMSVSPLKLLAGYPVTASFVIRMTMLFYTTTSPSITELFDIHMEFPTWSFTMTFFFSDSFIITHNQNLQHLITKNLFSPLSSQLWYFNIWWTVSWYVNFHSLVPILPSPKPPCYAFLHFLIIY